MNCSRLAAFVFFLFAASGCQKDISYHSGTNSSAEDNSHPNFIIECIPRALGPSGTGMLPVPRYVNGVAGLGTKILFAGGTVDGNFTTRVDVYDINTKTWTSGNISARRDYYMSVIGTGTKILMAGGLDPYSGEPEFGTTVDLYDVSTNTFSTSSIPVSRKAMAAVGYKGKFYLGGGTTESAALNRLDILDAATGVWTSSALSQARAFFSAAASGDQIFFAGGSTSGLQTCSSRIDIYDISTGTWSRAALSKARSFLGAAAGGDVVIFAGGTLSGQGGPTDVYDMYNVNTRTWTSGHLSKKRSRVFGALIGTKIIFGGDDNTLDYFDLCSHGWGVIKAPDAKQQTFMGAGVAGSTMAISEGYGEQPNIQFYKSGGISIQ